MTRDSDATEPDAKLLVLWSEWLEATAAELASRSESDAERADDAVRRLEKMIAETPANGLDGLAIKLGLAMFLGESDQPDISDEQVISAYADLVRLTGRDPLAEARAITEESNDEA